MENIRFQSYCWSLGTTSFRVKDLNFKIERQLQILDELWKENPRVVWNANETIQELYYNKMLEKNFIKGNAKNRAKDARQKTSGLVQLGVIDDNRKITPIRRKIIEIVETGDFKSDNLFNINKDSYLYLKQLLKMQIKENGIEIKPFIVLIYFLTELKYLTKEEFTYILPLCTNLEYTKLMLENIRKLRNGEITVDQIIQEKMKKMSNYEIAFNQIKEDGINTIEDFEVIDMGRKGIKYVEPMFKFYNKLYEVIQKEITEETLNIINEFIKEQSKKNSKIAKHWKKYLNYSSKMTIEDYKKVCKHIPIFKIKNKTEYALEFVKEMHTAKWKATLEDYSDLNKRYISLADIVIFNDDIIELDLFPKYFFSQIAKELFKTEMLDKATYDKFLQKNIELKKIYKELDIEEDEIINKIQVDYPDLTIEKENIKKFIENEKLRRFNQLIDKKFNENQLLELFDFIESNDKKAVLDYADWESDVPTIFEYLLGIAWFRISNKQGNILEFMKLSLDANLLPKTHAVGGTADIVYEYVETEKYPNHKVLLEATLTESTIQRKSEMEPVSRHLIRELQENENKKTYAIFVANILNEEILSDFRLRRKYQYRGKKRNVKEGLKIISLSIEDIKYLISKGVKYEILYSTFEEAYNDTTVNDLDWYEFLIKNKIKNF